MKLMMQEDNYRVRLNKLLFHFPLAFLIVAMIVAFIYHSITLLMSGASGAEVLNLEVYANSFFNGTIATVILYFLKSRYLGKILNESPENFAKDRVDAYFPCISGVWPHQHHGAFMTIEEDKLRLYIKKYDGYALKQEWNDLSLVRFKTIKESKNPLLPLLFGLKDSIEISDGKLSAKVLFSQPQESVEELNQCVSAKKI
jgi:hypothetical protein